jgi:hypothetical protein
MEITLQELITLVKILKSISVIMGEYTVLYLRDYWGLNQGWKIPRGLFTQMSEISCWCLKL